MARKDRETLKLAGKIREQRNKQKESVYERPNEDKQVSEARKRMKSKTGLPGMEKSIEEHNKRMREKKRNKQKKSFLQKLFGDKK
jgi:hypothetical protein